MSPERFEAEQKRLMLTNKLQALILNSIKVSDFEAKTWYDWENTQVDINFVQVNPKDIEDVTPTDEEITEYYEKNKNKYKTEPKVKIRYLKFSPDAYKSEVTITDEDIVDYYNENQSKAWLFGYVTGVNGAAFDIVFSSAYHKVKSKFKK